jgi:hypothetical protein
MPRFLLQAGHLLAVAAVASILDLDPFTFGRESFPKLVAS